MTTDYERAAERYAQLLGRSKGALMKAGQALSFAPMMSDAVAPEAQDAYRRALARLREQAPPMEAAIAREVLETEIGRSVEQVFSEFDAEPLAAASIGQVHRARLRDGREVAVKIQYPEVAAAIDADLANLELLSALLALLASFWAHRIGVDIRAVAREISAHIQAELDYRREADNQRTFADLYRGHPFIRVPEVVDDLSTSRVLTQDFVDGLRYDQACAAQESLRARWAEAVMHFGQGSLRTFGMINADPHPGNYRFHHDGTVSFLDYGCVVRFDTAFVEQLLRLVREALRGDADGTWSAALAVGIWTASDPVTPREAVDYFREPLAMYWGPQPFRITRELVRAGVVRHNAPSGPSSNAVRHLNSPRGYTLLNRLDVGVQSVIAGLDVAVAWRAVMQTFYEDGPPATEQSRQHWDFLARHHPSVTPAAARTSAASHARRAGPSRPDDLSTVPDRNGARRWLAQWN